MLTLSVGLATAAAVLGLTRGPVPGGSGFQPADLIIYLAFLAFLAWVVVGAVLVARRRTTRVVDETMRPAAASLWLRPDIRAHRPA